MRLCYAAMFLGLCIRRGILRQYKENSTFYCKIGDNYLYLIYYGIKGEYYVDKQAESFFKEHGQRT